jgi:hypothetical protein
MKHPAVQQALKRITENDPSYTETGRYEKYNLSSFFLLSSSFFQLHSHVPFIASALLAVAISEASKWATLEQSLVQKHCRQTHISRNSSESFVSSFEISRSSLSLSLSLSLCVENHEET